MIDVERGVEPASLASGRWSSDDVVVALHKTFFGKCYLCERRLDLGELEVEHRVPRNERPELAAEWSNLYPSCRSCNAQRAKRTPAGGLLSPGDGVETRLVQRAQHSADVNVGLECAFTATTPGDVEAANTAAELQALHTVAVGHGIRKRFKAVELLKSIGEHYVTRVVPLERRVIAARRNGQSAHEDEALLRVWFSRTSRFTMLIRSLADPSLADLFD